MKLSIMQPYFLPYLGYFQLILATDRFIAYDDVNFIKGGWINRNRLLMNGNIVTFTIGLASQSSFKKICETYLAAEEVTKSKAKLLKTLRAAYGKAAYFNEVFPFFEHIVLQQADTIAEYNIITLKAICDYLGIMTPIEISSYSGLFLELKAQDRVLALCKHHGATQYINPIGGRELYSREHFHMNGIELQFIKMNTVKYMQRSKEFVPNLSIVDVLMNCSKQETTALLDEYNLEE